MTNAVAGPAGLPFLSIRNELVRARVCLQGAQILEWQPRHARHPVLWVSNNARYAAGKSIRGGIPICWPWFGPHAGDGKLPAHGFARNLAWALRDQRTQPDGSVGIVLELLPPIEVRVAGTDGRARSISEMWPEAFALELHAVLGATLKVELRTRNRGRTDVIIGEALHSYFRVGEVSQVRVLGLENVEFADKTRDNEIRKLPGPVQCDGEVDRVY